MKVSFIHIYITKKLIESCNLNDNIIPRSKAVHHIYFIRMPSKCENKVLRELEEIGFIEIIDKKNIKVNKEEFEKYTSYF